MHYIERMVIEIEVTRDSSFCPGVDRAFQITEKMLFGKSARCFSVGPLIHNPEVVKRLEMLGLTVIDPDSDDLPDLEGLNVVIRSHGIDTETENRLESLGAVLVDATCPTVKRAQEAACDLLESGHTVLVLGAAVHPEVRSIVGRAGAPVTVIQSAEEARRWAARNEGNTGPVGVVCQTTIDRELLDAVLEVLQPDFDVTVKDTICESVARRQKEAGELAGRVDVMIVAGGRNSSNTAHLATRCEEAGVPTHLIEDSSEIVPEWIEGAGKVGVTGGASTPDWLIQETIERLHDLAGT
jgi:(E)-4-hydroxy-3-methyl-but-2-enyl pyrophosphate reductase